MRTVLLCLLLLGVSGCRVVSTRYEVNVTGDKNMVPSSGPYQVQASDKKLGDIAPRVSGVPGVSYAR